MTEPHVWSFDIGTGSFGIAVRKGLHFEDVRSLLIPDGFASVEDARKRRRMYRTREAHRAREEWLREIFERSGLGDAVLLGRRAVKSEEGGTGRWVTLPGDYRLEREFPPRRGEKTKDGAPSDAAGAEICYCGSVLRIRLLRGESLAPWQIFKALHSAIQKRGYDAKLPWKARERSKTTGKDDDEAKTAQAANEIDRELDSLPEGCRFPCYLEAGRMGLWSPAMPGETKLRQSHDHDPIAGTTKHVVFSRQRVEDEMVNLIRQAVIQLPALEERAGDIVYGPARRSYASYFPAASRDYEMRTGTRLVRGKDGDWHGVLSQKIPTFDNRALSKCSLIPRFHSAKASPRMLADGTLEPDSLLPAEVSFLMKLKNFRFDLPGLEVGRFSPSQIGEIFEGRRRDVVKKADATRYRLTRRELQNLIERQGGVALRRDHDVIEAPRLSGRSRFSKPALKIVKKLILSGKSPAVVRGEEIIALSGNLDPVRGLVPDDLNFLSRITSSGSKDASWDDFYLPDESLAFVENPAIGAEQKIREMIGRQNNPVVRHRLEVFWKLLRELQEMHGNPECVALEFVREDFMGPKAKMELLRFQSDRRKARAEARSEAGPGKDLLRYQLMKDQGGCCLYCSTIIGLDGLRDCHVDHIVPDESGGPGAYWNFALCCRRCNDSKGKRTPWQWFKAERPEDWDSYVARVRERAFPLRAKKVRLLTEVDAPDQVQRYQTLAETAWIARLARTLVCLHFGWPVNSVGEKRRVVVLPGGLTARVRRKYSLNSLLGQDIAALEKKLATDGDAKVEAEIEKKCRADKRHHALDAMVLSFLPQWTADPTKRIRVRLPDGIHRESIGAYLERVLPSNICFEKAGLEESLYGSRQTVGSGSPIATKRCLLADLGYTGINPVFKADTLKKDVAKIFDPYLKNLLEAFLREANPDETKWREFCREFRLPSRTGRGPVVKSVRLVVANDVREFKDLSKGDKRPALRRGDKHRGYHLYIDTSGKPRVRPVYAFESVSKTTKELLGKMGREISEMIGFFQSGCPVEIGIAVDHAKTPLRPGIFKLNTIRADGYAKLTSASGVVSEPINIAKLIQAGLQRK
jgi:CRISPR-associated endonuclease Csn1